MRTDRSLIVTAITLVAGLAVPTTARAQGNYQLRIDCYGYGGIENTGTTDMITVEFVGSGGERTVRTGANVTDGNCAPQGVQNVGAITQDFYGGRYGANVPHLVRSVRVSTSGDNGFWVDQLDLQGPTTGHWGANEGQGYCLSTDPTDANRSWSRFVSSRGCQPCFEFRVMERDVVNCGSASSPNTRRVNPTQPQPRRRPPPHQPRPRPQPPVAQPNPPSAESPQPNSLMQQCQAAAVGEWAITSTQGGGRLVVLPSGRWAATDVAGNWRCEPPGVVPCRGCGSQYQAMNMFTDAGTRVSVVFSPNPDHMTLVINGNTAGSFASRAATVDAQRAAAERQRIAAYEAERRRIAAYQVQQQRIAAYQAEQRRIAAYQAEQRRIATEQRRIAEERRREEQRRREAERRRVEKQHRDDAYAAISQGYDQGGDLAAAIGALEEAKVSGWDPVKQATQFAVDWARMSVRQGDFESAMQLADEVFDVDADQITAGDWNTLCWYGALSWPSSSSEVLADTWDQSWELLVSCERAVGEAGPAHVNYSGFRDSRGLVRALTHDVAGAIEDFEAFVSSPGENTTEDVVAQRRDWITALKAGTSRDEVFTAAVLLGLRH